MLNGLLNMSASPVSVICLGQSEGAVTLKTRAAERRGVHTHASRTRRSVDCASEPAKYEQRDEASEHEPAVRGRARGHRTHRLSSGEIGLEAKRWKDSASAGRLCLSVRLRGNIVARRHYGLALHGHAESANRRSVGAHARVAVRWRFRPGAFDYDSCFAAWPDPGD